MMHRPRKWYETLRLCWNCGKAVPDTKIGIFCGKNCTKKYRERVMRCDNMFEKELLEKLNSEDIRQFVLEIAQLNDRLDGLLNGLAGKALSRLREFKDVKRD